MADIARDAEPPDLVQEIPLLVKAALTDERMVSLRLGHRVTAILDIFAAERGCTVEELVLVPEGNDAPLTDIVLVEADYPRRRRHHVHLRSRVKVTVFYQAGSHEREFMRYDTVEVILNWAIETFNIDPSMATEFDLVLHGQKAELPVNEHVGHLAEHTCDLALDLIRGHISNG